MHRKLAPIPRRRPELHGVDTQSRLPTNEDKAHRVDEDDAARVPVCTVALRAADTS